MGLSKLLAVGRSVKSVTGQPARYKMTQQNLLPTFGSAKAGESHLESDASTVEEAAPKPAPAEPPEATATSAAPSEVVPATRERANVKADAFLQATRKLRPFGSWFRNPFSRAATSLREKQPVQTELSLDAVRPVRNELNESEIELGRPEPRAVSPSAVSEAPTGAPAPSNATMGSLWQRLKARWFGGLGTN